MFDCPGAIDRLRDGTLLVSSGGSTWNIGTMLKVIKEAVSRETNHSNQLGIE
jgi:hypothetical protein